MADRGRQRYHGNGGVADTGLKIADRTKTEDQLVPIAQISDSRSAQKLLRVIAAALLFIEGLALRSFVLGSAIAMLGFFGWFSRTATDTVIVKFRKLDEALTAILQDFHDFDDEPRLTD